MRFFNIVTLVILLFNSVYAYSSWDGATTGTINQIKVTGADNYGFRVVLEGAPPLCGNTHTWAYINEADSYYKTYVTVLMAAKMAKTTVTLYANKEILSGNDYCHIGFITTM